MRLETFNLRRIIWLLNLSISTGIIFCVVWLSLQARSILWLVIDSQILSFFMRKIICLLSKSTFWHILDDLIPNKMDSNSISHWTDCVSFTSHFVVVVVVVFDVFQLGVLTRLWWKISFMRCAVLCRVDMVSVFMVDLSSKLGFLSPAHLHCTYTRSFALVAKNSQLHSKSHTCVFARTHAGHERNPSVQSKRQC